jgi:hypothetical protein
LLDGVGMKKTPRKIIQSRRFRPLPAVELARVEGAGIGTSPSNVVPCVTVKTIVPCVTSVVPCVTVRGVQPCVG